MNTIAVIDIGTNSIRVGVHRTDGDHAYSTLALHKETVRLGQGEFAHNKITRAAMDRGVLVTSKFVDIAKRYEASRIVAVATAAVREAANQDDFVERVRAECGVNVKVVSGMEEARLIYLGVSSGADLNSSKALFMDIGGGTTELILGNAKDYWYLESLKLGAIRLADIFLRGRVGAVGKRGYRTMLDYARGVASHAIRKVRAQGFDLTFGSSGTIMSLAEVTARRKGDNVATIRNYSLTYQDLSETIAQLCDLNVEQRRRVPGISPDRADIIVSGAAILDAIMSGMGAESITISDRAMRDGILIDYLFQEDRTKEEYTTTSPRQRSVLQLCRSCHFEEQHANKVAELARSIFKQLGSQGMHPYSDAEEELLSHAAMVHDIGTFISHPDHHKHSYYLVRNWNLLGFSDEEVEVIATTAMCHRKAAPKNAASKKLSPTTMRLIDVLSSIVRIADALDRSQVGLVERVVCRAKPSAGRMEMDVYASADCPLELWWFENKKQLFEQTFGLKLTAKQIVV